MPFTERKFFLLTFFCCNYSAYASGGPAGGQTFEKFDKQVLKIRNYSAYASGGPAGG